MRARQISPISRARDAYSVLSVTYTTIFAMSAGLPPAAHTTSMTFSSARWNWLTKSGDTTWPPRAQPTWPATNSSSPVPFMPWLYPRGGVREGGFTGVKGMSGLRTLDDGPAVDAEGLAVD